MPEVSELEAMVKRCESNGLALVDAALQSRISVEWDIMARAADSFTCADALRSLAARKGDSQ